MVYVTFPPWATELGDASTETETSAFGVLGATAATCKEAVLLLMFGSVSEAEAVAERVKLAAEVGVIRIVTVAVAPLASVPIEAVTRRPARLVVPCVVVIVPILG